MVFKKDYYPSESPERSNSSRRQYSRRHEKYLERRQRKMDTRARRQERHDARKQRDLFRDTDRSGSLQRHALDQAVNMSRRDREQGRARGRQYADEVLNRQYQGLDPRKRLAIEESHANQVNRQLQGAQRQLSAQQGRSGVRGGAAYAQRADLARMGAEQQGELQRELAGLDADLALKKMAAGFNIEQGEASQAQLDRQMALDEARYNQERRRQQRLEEQYNRLFSRV